MGDSGLAWTRIVRAERLPLKPQTDRLSESTCRVERYVLRGERIQMERQKRESIFQGEDTSTVRGKEPHVRSMTLGIVAGHRCENAF